MTNDQDQCRKALTEIETLILYAIDNFCSDWSVETDKRFSAVIGTHLPFLRAQIQAASGDAGRELADMVIELEIAARSEGLYIGGGKNLNRPDTFKAQEGPMWSAIKAKATEISAAPATEPAGGKCGAS